MSLVAYTVSSSDEESEHECDEEQSKVEIVANRCGKAITQENFSTGKISDDEDDFFRAEVHLDDLPKRIQHNTLTLPKPKHNFAGAENDINEIEDKITLTFAALPMPKNVVEADKNIIEEDDEFLRKKAEPEKLAIEKPPPPKGPVKISIPALKDFNDVDKELAMKAAKSATSTQSTLKGSGLLNILPKAKSEQNFAKNKVVKTESNIVGSMTSPLPSTSKPAQLKPSLVPDTVKNRRPAYSTEGVDGLKHSNKSTKPLTHLTKTKTEVSLVTCSDSENSDDETGDFFSLKSDDKLPEVSCNELNALVASKAAKIADAPNKYLTAAAEQQQRTEEMNAAAQEEEMQQARKRYYEQKLDAEAMQALVGSSAKRRRKQQNEIEIMDISSAQVLPDRDEWMRTALASSTEYQATGVLNDDEPAAGTRRKHQITYLAHKAKSNEAELQAIWSANRQTRRATQSKYGF